MTPEEALIRLAEARKRVKFSAGSNGREILFVGDVNGLFEFNNALCEAIKLGEELRPKGHWVDFDPAKVTCDMFPFIVRASDNGIDWIADVHIFGYVSRSIYPFRGISRNYKTCQIWEAE